jgi:hypothetical protein
VEWRLSLNVASFEIWGEDFDDRINLATEQTLPVFRQHKPPKSKSNPENTSWKHVRRTYGVKQGSRNASTLVTGGKSAKR